MLSLLLTTFEMMALTFAIGFFVALVIKLIAISADSMDFYSSHQKELLRLRRLKKLRHKVAVLLHEVPNNEQEEATSDGLEDFKRGINRHERPYHGNYHGKSLGTSKMNLMDYYYSEDTHIMYLEDAMSHRQKSKPAKPDTNNKKK